MGMLKEKSKYRPSAVESALAWFFTAAAGAAVAWSVLGPWLRRAGGGVGGP